MTTGIFKCQGLIVQVDPRAEKACTFRGRPYAFKDLIVAEAEYEKRIVSFRDVLHSEISFNHARYRVATRNAA
jgi:hypothetical protein